MELTGKCKTGFENWFYGYSGKYIIEVFSDEDFYNLPLSMQWGVYQDFFDSVDIEVADITSGIDYYYLTDEQGTSQYLTREQARTAAIYRANEKYNL